MRTAEAYRPKRRGFTLIEVTISVSIFTTVVALTLGVVFAIARLNLRTEQKENLNDDYRRMAQVLADIGRTSNAIVVYPAYADRSSPVGDGNSGDLLVFLTYAPADVTGDPNRQTVSRIVGVYVSDGDGTAAPRTLRWFDSNRTNWGVGLPAPSERPAAELLPAVDGVYTGAVLAKLARGDVKGKLFRQLSSGSFMVNGTIHQNATSTQGAADTRTAYNLTVTTRS